MDPLSGQVLHHDCISVFVSRFAIVTENLVICCYQVTKFFSTKCGSAIASSARGPCNYNPLTDLAISVIREMRSPNPSRFLDVDSEALHEKNLRVSFCVQEHFHPRVSPNSCSHSGASEWHGSHRTCSWFSFCLGFGV